MSESKPGAQVPSIEESSEAIRELISLWKEHTSYGSVEIPIVDGNPLVGVSIHIMTQHSVALSESVLLLTAAKMFLQSAPLIRLTMECAVTAAWLSITPNAGNAARHEDARNRLATMNAIFEDPEREEKELPKDKELVEEAKAAVAELSEHKSEEARKFEARCKKFVGGEKLYPLYRMLSAYSHAGLGLTDLYLNKDESPTNPYGISMLDKSNYSDADSSLVQQVGMLALSMKAWDDILPAHPNRNALEKIAKEFGFGLEIKLAKVHS